MVSNENNEKAHQQVNKDHELIFKIANCKNRWKNSFKFTDALSEVFRGEETWCRYVGWFQVAVQSWVLHI